MSDDKVEESPLPATLSRPSRLGMIEILQVLSLLLFPMTWLLFERSWYRAAGACIAISLGLVLPLLLVKPPETEEGESPEQPAEQKPSRETRALELGFGETGVEKLS